MITVVMTTFVPESVPERLDYAARSIESLARHLKGDWKLHIADDGTDRNGFDTLINVARVWKQNVSFSRVNRKGIGGSLNAALNKLDTDVWMYTTDDWTLIQDYHLESALKLIEEGYDYVRIGHPHPNIAGTIYFQQGIGYWLHLTQYTGGYVFATRPFVATKKFYDRMGPFMEDANSYDVETDYNRRVCRSNTRLAALNLRGDEWLHIGEKEVGRYEPSSLH